MTASRSGSKSDVCSLRRQDILPRAQHSFDLIATLLAVIIGMGPQMPMDGIRSAVGLHGINKAIRQALLGSTSAACSVAALCGNELIQIAHILVTQDHLFGYSTNITS